MLSFWQELADPKYDTAFFIVKTIAAVVTFSAGVIGIYSRQTLRNSRLTRLGWSLIALLFVGTSLSIAIQQRTDEAQDVAYRAERSALESAQAGIVKLGNVSNNLLAETETIRRDSHDALHAIDQTKKSADLTIRRLDATDRDVQNSVSAARKSVSEDGIINSQQTTALRALDRIDDKNLDAVARLTKLTTETKTIADMSVKTLKGVHDEMYPILQPSGLHVGFNYEFDARAREFASVVQNFDALIDDYNQHCGPYRDGSRIYRDASFTFKAGELTSVEAFKHSDVFPSAEMLDQTFGAVQLDISFYSPKAQAGTSLGKSDLDLQVQAVPELNEQPQSDVVYWPRRHTLSLYQYADAPRFTPANGNIGGVDDLDGTRIVAQISRPATVARRYANAPALGEFDFFISGRRFVFNVSRPGAAQYDATMPNDDASLTSLFEAPKSDLPSSLCPAPAPAQLSKSS